MSVVAATRLEITAAPAPFAVKSRQDGPGRSLRWAIAAIFATTLIGAGAFILWLQIGEPGIDDVKHPIVSLNPQPALTAPTQSASQHIDDYIRHYNGGDCFLVIPTKIGDGKANVDGFGSGASSFEIFNDAFKKAMGFEPDIDFRRVTAAQCPMLGFLARVTTNSEASPRLEIEKANLNDGDVLQGSLQSSAANLQLLVVDDEGLIHDVSDRLEKAAERRTFAMQFKRHTEGPAKPMLLVAMASSAPIGAFKLAAPMPSADIVPIALAEQHGSGYGAALAYFKLN